MEEEEPIPEDERRFLAAIVPGARVAVRGRTTVARATVLQVVPECEDAQTALRIGLKRRRLHHAPLRIGLDWGGEVWRPFDDVVAIILPDGSSLARPGRPVLGPPAGPLLPVVARGVPLSGAALEPMIAHGTDCPQAPPSGEQNSSGSGALAGTGASGSASPRGARQRSRSRYKAPAAGATRLAGTGASGSASPRGARQRSRSRRKAPATGDTDPINLDVGGTHFRSTRLSLQKSNFFAGLLESGGPEDMIFVDRCPVLFAEVLQFLRTNQIVVGSARQLARLQEEFRFFGLDEDDIQTQDELDFELRHPGAPTCSECKRRTMFCCDEEDCPHDPWPCRKYFCKRHQPEGTRYRHY